MDQPPGKDYDLIICRNVLIYFDAGAESRIHGKFIDALRSGGILFLGGTEIINRWANLGVQNLSMCFYQKN
jgi:chemotaxis protein methyltransferase CheR